MKLLASSVLLVLVFSVFQEILAAPLTDITDCTDQEKNGKVIKLSIRSKRNESGDWITNFAAYGSNGDIPDVVSLDLKQIVTEKNKKESVLLQGIFGVVSPILKKEVSIEATSELSEEKSTESVKVTGGPIAFHSRTGENIRLSNNQRTAERINPKDDFNKAICVTDRPLKDNELFEVRLDEVISNWAGSLEFGVTPMKPTDIPLHTYFGDYSKGSAWFFGNENFDYPALWNYKVGDRFGVKKTPNGELQYFVNGKYIATSSSKVPKEVYGIIDLYANGVKATIINPPWK